LRQDAAAIVARRAPAPSHTIAMPSHDPSRAARQVLAPIAPYTAGAARALIERLGNRYRDKERR
jgi:hypothetical protein